MRLELAVGVVHVIVAGAPHGIVLGIARLVEHPVERLLRIGDAEILVVERHEYHEGTELLARIRIRSGLYGPLLLPHRRSAERHAAGGIVHQRGRRHAMGIPERDRTQDATLFGGTVHGVVGLHAGGHELRPPHLCVVEHAVIPYEVVTVHGGRVMEPFVAVYAHGQRRPVGLFDPHGFRIGRHGIQLPSAHKEAEEHRQRSESMR